MKIQKKHNGRWIDFVEIHGDSLPDEIRIVAGAPVDPIDVLLGEKGYPADIIDIIQEMIGRVREADEVFVGIPDDRIEAVINAMELGTNEKLTDTEEKYRKSMTALGLTAIDLVRALFPKMFEKNR